MLKVTKNLELLLETNLDESEYSNLQRMERPIPSRLRTKESGERELEAEKRRKKLFCSLMKTEEVKSSSKLQSAREKDPYLGPDR